MLISFIFSCKVWFCLAKSNPTMAIELVAEDNTQDFISTGGLREVVRISSESAREDIRNLAKKTLKLNRLFQAQMSAD